MRDLPAEYATIRYATIRSALEAAIKADRELGWIAECKLALAALDALAAREVPTTPPAPPAAECASENALRSLANEADGFLSMANLESHGFTNVRVLKLRIKEARAALATPCQHGEAQSEIARLKTVYWGLLEDIEESLGDFQTGSIDDIPAQVVKLRAELAQARKATEEAQVQLQHAHDGNAEWSAVVEEQAQQLVEKSAELRRAVDALRQIQWGNAGFDMDSMAFEMCPMCDQVEKNGHSPDCHVGASIAAYDAKHGEKI